MRPSIKLLRLASCSAALLTFLLSRMASAQTGTISGSVADSTGAGLANSTIQMQGTALHAATDDNGKYRLANVPPGTYTLRVLLLGYRSASRSVMVGAGTTVEASFVLERTPIQIGAVEVLVGSRAPHSAADELAVPVDVYSSEQISKQGTTETSQVLESL